MDASGAVSLGLVWVDTSVIVSVALVVATVLALLAMRWLKRRPEIAPRGSQAQFDDYVRSVEGGGAGDAIRKAKELLDSGAITQDEYEAIKASELRELEPLRDRVGTGPHVGEQAREQPSRPGRISPHGVSDRAMRVAITVILFVFALGVIALGDDEDTRNWAFGAIGTIVGYWFSDRTSEAHA